MTTFKRVKIPCQICGVTSTTQLFLDKEGNIKYARARHYIGKVDGKPQFEYHIQSLDYMQRKLNEMQKIDNPNTAAINGHTVGHIGHNPNDDHSKAEKPQTSCIQTNKAWASSSVRIEHQPLALVIFRCWHYLWLLS